jgi:hypothetical protein
MVGKGRSRNRRSSCRLLIRFGGVQRKIFSTYGKFVVRLVT